MLGTRCCRHRRCRRRLFMVVVHVLLVSAAVRVRGRRRGIPRSLCVVVAVASIVLRSPLLPLCAVHRRHHHSPMLIVAVLRQLWHLDGLSPNPRRTRVSLCPSGPCCCRRALRPSSFVLLPSALFPFIFSFLILLFIITKKS